LTVISRSSKTGIIILMATKGQGKAYQWILAHLDYPNKDWCLIWPFARDKHGRGMLGVNGEHHWAHRFMCRLAHGEPPTPKHTAAHICGMGHDGCVNPWHLDWKTQAENLEDCRAHGTLVRHRGGNVRRLMPEQIKAIRGARGFQTQCQLATKFGVSEGTISDIWHSRSHRDTSKVNHWSLEDIQKLRDGVSRGMNFTQLATLVGRPTHAVSTKAYRIGLKSGQPPIPKKNADRGLFASNGECRAD
jgi:transcriptional regulator with XRE-family HTH domain